MAIGIVFCATRAEQMTPEEDTRIEEISRKYMEEYKGKKFEGPGCIVGEEGEPVFSGSVRIPFRSAQNELDDFLSYWLRWLTEITYVLIGSEWEAGIEGVPLFWDEGIGWRLMTDEEYRNLMR